MKTKSQIFDSMADHTSIEKALNFCRRNGWVCHLCIELLDNVTLDGFRAARSRPVTADDLAVLADQELFEVPEDIVVWVQRFSHNSST